MNVDSPAMTVVRPWIARWTSRVARALLLAAFGLASLPAGLGSPWPTMAGASMLISLVVLVASYVAMLATPASAGSVEVRDGRVVIEARRSLRVIETKKIAAALVVTRAHHGQPTPVVEIRTRRGTHVTIVVADEAAAHALVDAIGFGPKGRALELHIARRARRFLHPLLAVLASVIGFLGAIFTLTVVFAGSGGSWLSSSALGLWCFTAIALMYSVLKRLFAAPTVKLGSDGFAVKRRFETRRIPRWEIVGITVPRPGGPLVVESRSGHNISIDGVLVDHALLDGIAAEAERRLRIEEIHPRAGAFARDGNDVKAWKASLRSLLDAGYREAGATVEDASAVLASPGSTIEQRLGAALALRVAGEPPERIRVAAESVVDPKLRVAFEAVADDEDERLDKTLRKLAP
jgi:hypothetical protein